MVDEASSSLTDSEIDALFEEVSEASTESPDPEAEEPEDVGRKTIVNLEDLPPKLKRMLDIKVPVVALLAHKEMQLKDVLSLHSGMVLELGKPLDEPISLCIGNEEIAYGETVKIGERFGLQITELKETRKQLESMKSMV